MKKHQIGDIRPHFVAIDSTSQWTQNTAVKLVGVAQNMYFYSKVLGDQRCWECEEVPYRNEYTICPIYWMNYISTCQKHIYFWVWTATPGFKSSSWMTSMIHTLTY